MIDRDKVREILKKAGLDVEPSEEEFDKPFKEIGLDSLDVFNFLSELEVSLDKTIEDSEFENIKTLNDVIQFVNA